MVLDVVAADVSPVAKIRKHLRGGGYVSKYSDGLSRDHVSYLIEVRSPTGMGKDSLYWPRVQWLKRYHHVES